MYGIGILTHSDPVTGGATSPFAGVTPVASLAHADGSVTLVEGQTFCLSGRTGDMSVDFPHGLFVLDTRVLSRWELRVDGERLEPLTVDIGDPFSATFVGRAHPAAGQADADVVVFRRPRHRLGHARTHRVHQPRSRAAGGGSGAALCR